MKPFILSVKSRRVAENIARALNHIRWGDGERYMDGYMRRRMTEEAACKANQKR